MSLEDEIKNLKCPYCGKAPLETTISIPIVEGQGLWHETHQRQLIGSVDCVKKMIAKEVNNAKDKVNGSPSAFFLSFFPPAKGMIPKVKKDLEAVRKVLEEAGISELPENMKQTDIAYSLAIGMIKADGRVEQDEIDAAIEMGHKTFPDFDEAEFRKRLNSYKFLPTIQDLSLLLKILLKEEDKEGLIKYLVAISASDGDIADEEVKLLKTVAACLDFTGDVTKMLPSVQ